MIRTALFLLVLASSLAAYSQPGRSLAVKPIDSNAQQNAQTIAEKMRKEPSYSASARLYFQKRLSERGVRQMDTAALRQEFFRMLDTNYVRDVLTLELQARMNREELRTSSQFFENSAGKKLLSLLAPSIYEKEYWPGYLKQTFDLAATRVRTDSLAYPVAAAASTNKSIAPVVVARRDSIQLVRATILPSKPAVVRSRDSVSVKAVATKPSVVSTKAASSVTAKSTPPVVLPPKVTAVKNAVPAKPADSKKVVLAKPVAAKKVVPAKPATMKKASTKAVVKKPAQKSASKKQKH